MAYQNIESIRAWEPGDGLTCSQAKQAPRDIPCGPPVVTYEAGPFSSRPGGPMVTRKQIACRNHLPHLDTSPGELAAAARRAAVEQLVVNHWDEYQALTRKATDDAVAASLSTLPPEIAQLLMNATTTEESQP